MWSLWLDTDEEIVFCLLPELGSKTGGGGRRKAENRERLKVFKLTGTQVESVSS